VLGEAVFPNAICEIHNHSGIACLSLFYMCELCGLVDSSHDTVVG
jgi:hypothetical protein